MDRPRILLTGAAGLIGSHLAPRLRDRYALRLFDTERPRGEADDEVVVGDILDEQAIRDACRGVAAVVHLAGIPNEADFDDLLLPINLQGVHTVFEAARQEGVPKVVFASTIQTVLGYSPDDHVTPDMPVRPITAYACTKVFGEALARLYSDQHGMSMLCLRIGAFQPPDSEMLDDRDARRIWVSPDDMAHMVDRCLTSDVRFGVLFAVSSNRERFVDIEAAGDLVGYRPKDDAETTARRG